ncbi:MAG: GNAT family N-acetyltransferase [Acidobacteriota bacterium]
MEILQDEHGRNGAFYIEEDGEWIAELTYVKSQDGKTITIDHTQVDEKLRGQGVGEELVARAVNFSREKGFKIIPLCPYARKIMERTSEYQDVRA